MAIDFPNSPTVNDTHTSAGVTWKWDGTTWKAEGVTSSYILPTASATVLGGVKVGTNLSINGSGVLSSTDNNTTYTQSASASGSNVNLRLTPNVGIDDDILVTAGTNVSFSSVTAAGFTINAAGGSSAQPEITWTLGANGSTDYTFTGSGFTSATNDPTLYLIRGQTYKFDNQTGGHPFRIQSTVAQAGGGTAYNSGVTNNDASGGNTLTFVVPMNAPDKLYYQCTAHPAMTGTIHVITQGASSGLQSRTTGAATSTGLADAAAGNLTIVAAKSYILHKIQTSHAAWVTVYTDSTARTNDAARSESTDPLPGTGVIAEVITSDGATQPITPGTIGWNNEGTPTTNAYVKVVNKSGNTADVTVTLHFVAVEA